MKNYLLIATFFLLFSTLGYSQDESIKTTNFGKGILNIVGKDSTWSMNFSARMQILSTSEWDVVDDKFTNPSQEFLLRRSRLKFNGFAYSPKLTYKMEIGLSNNDISGGSQFTGNTPRYIYDAVIMWSFYKNASFWAGQTKLPGNVERVISSGNMQLVDRSMLNSEFNIDRDMGIQLRNHFTLGKEFLIRQKLAMSQGEGRNVTTGNLGGHQYTARLEFLPFGEFEGEGDYSGGDLKREITPKLSVASTYDFNNNAVKTRSNQGSYMFTDVGFFETNIKTLFVDAMFKYRGFSFMGEFADRSSSDPLARNSDGTLTGDAVQVGQSYNLQTGYLFKNNYEIATRFTQVKLDKTITGENLQKQFTLGVSKYIVGHKLKIQSDVSYLGIQNASDQVMWRLQMDLHF
ncbi:porin [uncultured Flavobacterium sp.]|uniref:porin n=1 Tax=uncultured Flavobacterium sp. TaxID=165435 RepID=UPI0030EB4CAF|tara:strand:- start:7461 stop:8669 length:1209 start_codon:yes stop_codon:yes gene_type:complete